MESLSFFRKKIKGEQHNKFIMWGGCDAVFRKPLCWASMEVFTFFSEDIYITRALQFLCWQNETSEILMCMTLRFTTASSLPKSAQKNAYTNRLLICILGNRRVTSSKNLRYSGKTCKISYMDSLLNKNHFVLGILEHTIKCKGLVD